MNRSFKSIWCEKTATFVAVGEISKSKGKRSSGRKLLLAAVLAAASSVAVAGTLSDDAVPEPSSEVNAVVLSEMPKAAAATGEMHYYSVNDGGTQQKNYNNDGAKGAQSMAAGIGAVATGTQGIAIGFGAAADLTNTRDGVTYYSDRAIAIGSNSKAWGADTVVLGTRARAGGLDSVSEKVGLVNDGIAIGRDSQATGKAGVAIGADSKAGTPGALAIGAGAKATGSMSTVFGNGAEGKSVSSIALGNAARAGGSQALAVGDNAEAMDSHYQATAIGAGAKAKGVQALAVGAGAEATSGGAFGTMAVVSAASALALGTSANASTDNGVALGSSALADRAAMDGSAELFSNTAVASKMGAVSVGKTGNERQITNVAGGTKDTDAVNVRQLKSSNQQIVGVIGGSTTIDATTGAVKGPFISLNGNTYSTVGDAITGVNVIANKGWNVQANGDTATNVAPGGKVQLIDGKNIQITRNGADITIATTDAPTFSNLTTNNLTVNESTTLNGGATISKNLTVNAGTTVNMGGNTVTNVAAGENDGDAVNMSQLNETKDSIQNIYKTGTKYFHANSTGTDSSAVGTDSVAIGMGAVANNADGVALGSYSVANTAAGVIGYVPSGASAAQSAAIAATTSTLGAVSVGNAAQGKFRQITGVAAGTNDSDAVNVAQLKGVVGSAVDQATQNAVTYDDSTHTTVTLNKGGPSTTITNVAAGNLSEGSTDAVNGSQLWETNNRVTNVENKVNDLGDQINNLGDTVNSINNGGGIRYFRHNVSNDSMPDASANGKESVAVGSGATTTAAATNSVAMGINAKVDAANGIALGSGSSVTIANSVALGAGSVADKAAVPVNSATVGNMTYSGFAGHTPNGVVSVGAQGAERQITNVAAGRITADSTDAVNGSQLYSVADGLNRKIDNSIQYDSTTDTDGNQKPGTGSDLTLKGDGGTQIHNVADGEAPNDAATVGQLNNAVAGINQQMNALDQKIETVNKDANAGTAGAMAIAGMPQATIPGKSMMAAGVAAYQGQAAIAMGVSKLSDNGRWIVKLSGTANTRGKVGVAGGVGFHW